MGFPAKVLEDIQSGKEYLSDLNATYITELKKGCDSCTPKNYSCLSRVLKSLDYKIEVDQYDVVAENLYKTLMIIIGGVSYVPPVVYDAIYTGTGIPTTQEQILLGVLTPYTIGGNMLANFENSSYLTNYLAIPITAPVPTQYINQSNPFDTGPIGSPSDLFGSFTEVGSFRVTITNYPIPLTNTYLFL